MQTCRTAYDAIIVKMKRSQRNWTTEGIILKRNGRDIPCCVAVVIVVAAAAAAAAFGERERDRDRQTDRRG